MAVKQLDIIELQAEFCRTLAHPTRLRILTLLGRQEMSVGELATALGVSLSNVSQHLGILKAPGLVVARRRGQTVSYRLADRRILRACAHVHAVVLRHLRERGNLAAVTASARPRRLFA